MPANDKAGLGKKAAAKRHAPKRRRSDTPTATAKSASEAKNMDMSATASASEKGPAVAVTKAKGRPMLSWVGKRPLRSIASFAAQPVESFAASTLRPVRLADEAVWQNWPQQFPRGGLIFHGDNKEVLGHLLANGFRRSVQLIYIDPPFDSGADYIRKVTLRGPRGSAKLDGESYTFGEQIQYADIWANDNYLQFMFERIILLKELLADNGSLFLHCDFRRSHHLRCLLDEVFGPDNFVNEIVWVHQIMGGSHEKRFPKAHETIFWYAKTNDYRLRSESKHVRVPFSEYVLKSMKTDETGQKYYERRRMSRKATSQEAESKAHTRTNVDDPEAGTVATDVWQDMPSYQEPPDQRDGLELYPTQKTTKLLTRIVAAASSPGGLVLDSFCGSGVLARVAQQLGRRWIVCDINKGAIQTTTDRLQRVISGQAQSAVSRLPLQAGANGDDGVVPAQVSFTTWRVNDYDLAIQHNEAVNLACEHIGVTRTLTDSFFDGSLGKKLVKIVPFGHPLSPIDLEEVRKELNVRASESRDVVIVSLGKEVSVDGWLAEWNRLRKQGDTPNKIEVIELRTDPKYGKFFDHRPPKAKVDFRRSGDKIRVEIEDFVSPSIIERLQQINPLLSPKITNWRAMVDSVMIDNAYHGAIFNVTLTDVPETREDYVQGTYELAVPGGETTVAIKITDMLGEEVIVARRL